MSDQQAVTTRRAALKEAGPGQTTHAGLWLDRYIVNQARDDKENPHRQTLVKEVADLATPFGNAALYRALYLRWVRSLGDETLRPLTDDYVVRRARFKVRSRMIVGIGAESVLENAITLHRTYGVPYIPGSALKGLAASYAHQRLADERWRDPSVEHQPSADTPSHHHGAAHTTLFGDTDAAGYVTFFDAWYVPDSGHKDPTGQSRALYPDVLTVHHQTYYQGDKPTSPADWDKPIPLPLLSATGEYLVALAGPSAWVDAALAILKLALADMGIGAKTSSGYGRMDFVGDESSPENSTYVQVVREALAGESRQTSTPGESAAREQVPRPLAAPQPGIVIPQTGVSRTAEGTVVGVGAQDASLLLPGNRRGRARFGPTLPRKPNSGERVLVELDADGNPVLIVEIL